MPTAMPKDQPTAAPAAQALSPETTPIPGGGSWRWTDTGWVASIPDQPLQPGDIGALQTTDPTQE